MTFDEDLSGIADVAIVEAASNFRRGLVEGQKTEYAPSSATFCVEARRIDALLPYRNQQRLPKPSNETPYGDDARGKVRMRLKMPMFNVAMQTGRMGDLAAANAAGLEAMIALANSWGVPVPEDLFDATDDEWLTARRRGWVKIEQDQPPFVRGHSEIIDSEGTRGFSRPTLPINRGMAKTSDA